MIRTNVGLEKLAQKSSVGQEIFFHNRPRAHYLLSLKYNLHRKQFKKDLSYVDT